VSSFVNNSKFNVRFSFNRLPLKLQYRACVLAMEEGLDCLLFPSPDNICTRGLCSVAQKRK
jgi:helicase MOV-10